MITTNVPTMEQPIITIADTIAIQVCYLVSNLQLYELTVVEIDEYWKSRYLLDFFNTATSIMLMSQELYSIKMSFFMLDFNFSSCLIKFDVKRDVSLFSYVH